MKKILILSLFIALIYGLNIGFVFAQEVAQEITTKDLGIENPGILPTSPFYFFKNFTRGVKRIFTVDPVKRADLELEIANQQAAEIKKLEEIAPNRVEAILKAVANYQSNIERLKNRLESLKETSQNPNIDKLMEKLIDRSIKHQQLFDELKKKFEGKEELKQRFETAQEKMSETVAKIPEKFETSGMFRERLDRILKNQPEKIINELRKIEIIDRIGGKMPIEQRQEMEAMKENMMKEFGDKMEKMPVLQRMEMLRPEAIENLPGDSIRMMKIFGEMKDYIVSPEVRNNIKEIGEMMLKRGIEKQEIRKEEVEKLISYAKDLIVRAENALAIIPSEELRSQAKKWLESAKSHLLESESALQGGKIGEAFGRVNAAGVEAKKVFRIISFGPEMMNREPSPMPQPFPFTKPIGDDQIVCTTQYLPVCGADGKTYSNACFAKVAGVAKMHEGACEVTNIPTTGTTQFPGIMIPRIDSNFLPTR